MTETDITIRPSDNYFVITAARRNDTMTRFVVGGTSDKVLAIDSAGNHVAGMVYGFASREEAQETYPNLQHGYPALKRILNRVHPIKKRK